MEEKEEGVICPDCGARQKPGADTCDLCGHSFDEPAAEGEFYAEDEMLAHEAPVYEERQVQGGVFCSQCGAKNPEEANFCFRCGSRIYRDDARAAFRPPLGPRAAAAPQAAVPRSTSADKAIGRQLGIIVGAAVLIVVALYMVTLFSRSTPAPPGAPVAETGTPAAAATSMQSRALTADAEAEVARLRAEMDGLGGAERLSRQRRLVALYLDGGRIDLAAQEQEQIAAATDSLSAWEQAGNLYYGWMESSEGEERVEAGRSAIRAYQKVLDEEPNNLGVRTDMATAFLGTNDPMEGVRQIKLVLESDPRHEQANFNYGVMLSMIGRNDQALEQFKKVKEIAAPGSNNYTMAEQAIQQLGAAPAQP